jgi:CTP:molybdopterin cytidylyltransferase MocA
VSLSLVVLAAGLARRYGGCKPLAPVGPNGEAVIDLLVSDAVAAGFDHVILVLHPETGPAIRYHVERCWPNSVNVSFAEQRLPLGTVHATLAARDQMEADQRFVVCNADDVYGEEALAQLAERLGEVDGEHVLVAYRLSQTTSTSDPVTRGICQLNDGELVGLTERRQVVRLDNGNFEARDGLEPARLSGDLPTSVNLWGFQPAIWDFMTADMERSGLDENALQARKGDASPAGKAEVLLPEMVAEMVVSGAGLPVRVVPTEAKLLGVTHAADLPVVTGELSRQVAMGTRPATLWPDAG